MQNKGAERSFYDQMFSKLQGLEDGACITYGYDEIYARTVDSVEKGRLLDVGCGAGKHSVNFAQRGFRVVGIDMSWPALKAAKEWAEHNGLSILLVQADVEHMPFREHVFDSAFCGLLLHHFLNQKSIIKEIARVTKDHVFGIETNALEPITFLKFNVYNAFIGHPKMSPNQRALYPHRLRRLFQEAGFSKTHLTWINVYSLRNGKSLKAKFVNLYVRALSLLPRKHRCNKFVISCHRIKQNAI